MEFAESAIFLGCFNSLPVPPTGDVTYHLPSASSGRHVAAVFIYPEPTTLPLINILFLIRIFEKR